jgi:hypothetical protein
VALIFALAGVGIYVEWSLGWLDWVGDERSYRLRQSYRVGVLIANVIVGGIIVFIPVQLFAPDEKEDVTDEQ